MRKLFLLILLTSIILVGCNNDETYNNAIQKGLDHIASEEYQKAESAFELALDEKEDDEKAKALLQQTVYYQGALKAIDEGELDSTKEKAGKVINIENGSSALIKKSEDMTTSIEEFEAELIELTQKYETALKLFDDKKYEEAKEIVDNILKTDLEQPIFKSIKKKVEGLKKDIESTLAGNKKVEKEKINQDSIDKEINEKEETQEDDFSFEKAMQIAESDVNVNGDTGVTLFMEIEYENDKPYYSGNLYSKEMKADGGSGILVLIKVFEDGLIIDDDY